MTIRVAQNHRRFCQNVSNLQIQNSFGKLRSFYIFFLNQSLEVTNLMWSFAHFCIILKENKPPIICSTGRHVEQFEFFWKTSPKIYLILISSWIDELLKNMGMTKIIKVLSCQTTMNRQKVFVNPKFCLLKILQAEKKISN